MTKKKFSELTERGQKQRLAKYDKEREARGTTEVLARLVRPASIKDIADDAKLAVVRLAVYEKETNATKFFTASAYIAKGKEALQNFYASLEKGQLVSVEYKENKGYLNIYNMMDRSYADDRKKNAKSDTSSNASVQVEQELEV